MGRKDVIVVGGLLLLLAAAAVLAPRAAQWLPREPAASSADGAGAAGPARPTPAPAPAEVRISVKLYFEDAELPSLTAEDREISSSGDLALQVKTVVEELIKGSTQGNLAPLPEQTRVLATFVAASGTAYVDLSKEAVSGGGAGSTAERLAVYAIVDSIAANFPAIRRVQLLVEDRALETLQGHLDLSRPLSPDMTLVASKEPPVEASGEPAAAAGPVEPPLPAVPPSPRSRPSGGADAPPSRSP